MSESDYTPNHRNDQWGWEGTANTEQTVMTGLEARLKTISKSRDHLLRFWPFEHGFIIEESNRWLRHGYIKATWERTQVFVTLDELRAILKAAEEAQQ